MDSNILVQIVGTKAKKRENKIARILRAVLREANTPTFSRNFIGREKKKLNTENNYVIRNKIEFDSKWDNMETLLNKIYTKHEGNNLDLNIIRSINNKAISGIRFEASGRLTKRFTAQRSIFKLKYKGTLKNVDSAYKGFSTKLIRNNLGSNIQYTSLNSHNRIGAFGIKG